MNLNRPAAKSAAIAFALCAVAGSPLSEAVTANGPTQEARHENLPSQGRLAWTRAATSTGLYRLDQPVTVAYAPARTQVPAGAVITHVHANRDYAGQADVQTSLCWNGTERCIDIMGRSVTTRAFAGLDATAPMHLVHRVTTWRGSRPPLFVKGNVTVWYETPAESR